MKILYVLPFDPRFKLTGAGQRTMLLWDALRKVGDTYAVFFDPNAPGQVFDDHLESIGIRPGASGRENFLFRVQTKIPHIFRTLEFGPVLPWTDRPAESLFGGMKFDLIVGRYVNSSAIYHLWKQNTSLLVDFDDNYIASYDSFVSVGLSPLKRRIGHSLMSRQLHFLARRIDGGWIANSADTGFLNPTLTLASLPNIPFPISGGYERDFSVFDAKKNNTPHLIFVAALKYRPNHQGLDTFLSTIWPIFHAKHPEVIFDIVGGNAPSEYVARWSCIPGVVCHGYVDDLNPLYSTCVATVVPVEQGSGTCIKTLESLDRHVPCISTPFGLRGIEEDPSVGLFAYRDADEFEAAYSRAKEMSREEAEAMAERMDARLRKDFSREAFDASVAAEVRRVIDGRADVRRVMDGRAKK